MIDPPTGKPIAAPAASELPTVSLPAATKQRRVSAKALIAGAIPRPELVREVLQGWDGKQWSIALDSRGQHTIFWDEDLKMGSRVLQAGSANLYNFPAVKFAHQEFEDDIAAGEGLEVLLEVMRQVLSETDFFSRTDAVGAEPAHALLVANDDESISMAFEIFSSHPHLMTSTHKPGPFAGEGMLHILLANSRFDECKTLLRLASEKLDDSGLDKLVRSKAVGAFFTNAPMKLYGSSPLGFACHFNAKDVVGMMLSETRLAALLDVNEDACPLTGYYPLHATVSSGSIDMVKVTSVSPTLPAGLVTGVA